MIADLGEARIAREKQTGLVMPDVYRAPEVSFCIDWDNKIDIWAIGLTVSADHSVVTVLILTCGIDVVFIARQPLVQEQRFFE